MSRRQLARLRADPLVPEPGLTANTSDDTESGEVEDVLVQNSAPMNVFSLLDSDPEDDDEVARVPTSVPSTQAQPSSGHKKGREAAEGRSSTTSSGKGRKNKKKNKKKNKGKQRAEGGVGGGGGGEEASDNSADDSEDLDALLEEFQAIDAEDPHLGGSSTGDKDRGEQTPSKSSKSRMRAVGVDADGDGDSDDSQGAGDYDMVVDPSVRDLLRVDKSRLSIESELRRIFGGRITAAPRDTTRKHGKKVRHRKSVLTTPQPTWPRYTPQGLQIVFVKTRKGSDEYSVYHDNNYDRAEQIHLAAVETMDPNNLVRLARELPYHINNNMRLAESYRETGNHEISGQFICKVLYAFECEFPSACDIFNGDVHMSFASDENEPFFRALFRHMQIAGQSACFRTALELGKLIVRLDNRDPLFVLLVLDYYAVQAQQYTWVIEMLCRYSNGTLVLLPNWAFSAAIALWHLEKEGDEKPDCLDKGTFADDLLQRALIQFPMLLLPLADKCSIPIPKEDKGYSFFTKAHTRSRTLQHAITLYVERSAALWKVPDMQQFLSSAVSQVLSRLQQEEGQTFARKCGAVLDIEYPADAEDIFITVDTADYAGTRANAIPQEDPGAVMGAGVGGVGGAVMDNFGGPADQRARAAIPENIPDNALAAFFQTLLPWNRFAGGGGGGGGGGNA